MGSIRSIPRHMIVLMTRNSFRICTLWVIPFQQGLWSIVAGFSLRDNYLYAIIKVRNDLRAIEILKSSSVPSSEVFFIYVPLSLVFLVTARGKDDFARSYRMHQNFHSFLRCHCNFLWFKKLNFFLCTIMKKIMVTACTCACEKL